MFDINNENWTLAYNAKGMLIRGGENNQEKLQSCLEI